MGKPVPDTDGNVYVPQQTNNGPRAEDGDQSLVSQDSIPDMGVDDGVDLAAWGKEIPDAD